MRQIGDLTVSNSIIDRIRSRRSDARSDDKVCYRLLGSGGQELLAAEHNQWLLSRLDINIVVSSIANTLSPLLFEHR